jgi:hypothetical protein
MSGIVIAWILIGWMIWCVIGCGVLAAIDDDEKRLFHWAKKSPIVGGYTIVVTAWPVILWMWWRSKR